MSRVMVMADLLHYCASKTVGYWILHLSTPVASVAPELATGSAALKADSAHFSKRRSHWRLD
jgi:hypothetical protein